MQVILTIGITMFLTSCATIESYLPWGDDEKNAKEDSQSVEPEASSDENVTDELNPKEFDKRLASLNARVFDLEQRERANYERIKVLERGMVLGLVPQELLDRAESQSSATTLAKPQPIDMPEDANASKAPDPSSKASDEDYRHSLTEAHKYFRSGQYGKAIVAYAEIGKNYPASKTKGNHAYWISMSWFHLKEFDLAKKSFKEFIAEHPESAWLPRAKLYLAKTDIKLGLTTSAAKDLKDIIKAYPNEDASEMAKLELEGLESNL